MFAKINLGTLKFYIIISLSLTIFITNGSDLLLRAHVISYLISQIIIWGWYLLSLLFLFFLVNRLNSVMVLYLSKNDDGLRELIEENKNLKNTIYVLSRHDD